MARLDPYINLLSAYLEAASIDDRTFETQYLDLFKGDQTIFPDAEFEVLDRLFGDVDRFEPDPELREPDYLDETGLREGAVRALAALRSLGEGEPTDGGQETT